MTTAIRVTMAAIVIFGLTCYQQCIVENSSAQEAKRVQFKDPVVESMRAELSRISVGTLNRFHLALVCRVLDAMPRDLELTVAYGGLVASENGRNNLRVNGSIGAPLKWTVFGKDGLGVFWLTIASQRNDRTVCTCRFGKEFVYVEITGIDDAADGINEKSLNQPMKNLGDRSVLKVIKLLEGEPGRME